MHLYVRTDKDVIKYGQAQLWVENEGWELGGAMRKGQALMSFLILSLGHYRYLGDLVALDQCFTVTLIRLHMVSTT